MRPNFHVNISEQFTIRECVRPSFEGLVKMSTKMITLEKKSHVVRLGVSITNLREKKHGVFTLQFRVSS